VSEPRDSYLGAYVTRSVKEALCAEALRRNTSISQIVQTTLARGFKLRYKTDGNRPGQGRLIEDRGQLSADFRAAILASRQSLQELAERGGFPKTQALSRMLRGGEVVLTEKTKTRILGLAHALKFKGETLA